MTISSRFARIRAYLEKSGVKRNTVARAAGLNWHAVNCVIRGDPHISTIIAIESVVPDDFNPED